MATVTYCGREYQVEATGNANGPYLLYGPRGACYGLMRSRQRPDELFPVKFRGRRVVLPGRFSDRNGTLREIG